MTSASSNRHAGRTLLVCLLALTLAAAPAANAERGNRDERAARSAHGGPQHRPGWQPGQYRRELPREHRVVTLRRAPYYYGRGVYWRPRGRDYVLLSPPIGVWVPFLPYAWASFSIGPRRYFRAYDDYYLWEPRRREYEVVRKPTGADEALREATRRAAESTEVFAYPAKGQSAATADRDRYECHLWAERESGFDPSEPGDRSDSIPDYRRALTACLEGRGYSVK